MLNFIDTQAAQILLHHVDIVKEITYGQVYARRSDCARVQRLTEYAHEEYERWMRRDPREISHEKPATPNPAKSIIFDVPLFDNVAAATSEDGPSDIADTRERFASESMKEHAAQRKERPSSLPSTLRRRR